MKEIGLCSYQQWKISEVELYSWNEINGSDDFKKMQIKIKLKELADLSSIFLIEPTVKAKTWGQPSQKFDKSTLRDPSRFKYVVSTQDNHSSGLVSSSTTTKKP